MNNKGMTLVELLITFSILMIIVVGMFNMILDVRLDLDSKRIVKDINEYSNFINHDIQYDMITSQPFAIAYKNSSDAEWYCVYGSRYYYDNECSIGNSNTFSVDIRLEDRANEQKITGSYSLVDEQGNDVCKGVYPCAIYAYYNESTTTTGSSEGSEDAVGFKIIAFNIDNTNNQGYGVRYGNTYQQIPHQDYINKKRLKNAHISVDDSNSNIVIEYPIYVSGEKNNYGFMAVYPFNIEKDSD